ncbi:hypothetical protein RHMOL_Rhmol04G0184900 [Rhododendron molle]|uniref:Uncharacterized protein n=1 Tax=Rhododendron molle TaxID=49168 RepID=A0ACC0P256_RHOML|nr:hypothetical protein RHMOL_Rhmol04G0184900 [Rhododendron molle]
MMIQDQEIPKSDHFRYLGLIISIDEEITDDVTHRIQVGWLKWRSATGVLCDKRVPTKLKGKFYETAIRPAMLYGTKYWPIKKQKVRKMSVAEMRMLRWMCGKTRQDRIRNETIREMVGVAPIKEKLRENKLRWFGHVYRRLGDAVVRKTDMIAFSSNVSRDGGWSGSPDPGPKRPGRWCGRWLVEVWQDLLLLGAGTVSITLVGMLVSFLPSLIYIGNDRICLMARRLDGGAGMGDDAYSVLCYGGLDAG